MKKKNKSRARKLFWEIERSGSKESPPARVTFFSSDRNEISRARGKKSFSNTAPERVRLAHVGIGTRDPLWGRPPTGFCAGERATEDEPGRRGSDFFLLLINIKLPLFDGHVTFLFFTDRRERIDKEPGAHGAAARGVYNILYPLPTCALQLVFSSFFSLYII